MSGQENLISLKEASRISGYTPDYVGQLIRSGKIKGEKVYCQISWMTTEQEVLAYKNNSVIPPNNSEISQAFKFFHDISNRIKSEFKFLKVFLSNIRTIAPILLTLGVCLILLTFFILDLFFNPDGRRYRDPSYSVQVPVTQSATY